MGKMRFAPSGTALGDVDERPRIEKRNARQRALHAPSSQPNHPRKPGRQTRIQWLLLRVRVHGPRAQYARQRRSTSVGRVQKRQIEKHSRRLGALTPGLGARHDTHDRAQRVFELRRVCLEHLHAGGDFSSPGHDRRQRRKSLLKTRASRGRERACQVRIFAK